MKTLDKCRSLGMQVDEVSVDQTLLNAIDPVYQVIAYAEATSNMSNLTGIIFGPRAEGKNYVEMMKKYRTDNFCSLIKRRFIIGSYVFNAIIENELKTKLMSTGLVNIDNLFGDSSQPNTNLNYNFNTFDK